MVPSMKMEKVENFQNKMGLKGCNWCSLDTPCIKIHLSHPILDLGESPNNWPSGVIRNGSQYENARKDGKFSQQNVLKGQQMV